jgi:hypothetical protein
MTIEGGVAVVTGGASGPGAELDLATDRLDVHIWRAGDGVAAFRTVNQRGEVVLDRGVCTFGRPLTSSAP